MAHAEIFVIRRAFLIPLGLLLLLCLVLLGVCFIQNEPGGKIMILSFITLPVAVLFVESIFRRVAIDGEKVTMFKFLRRRSLRLSEVTAVETVQVRKRAFLTLCAGDDFLIMSNAYGDFPRLVQRLLPRVPAETVTEDTRRMAAAPPRKSTDIVSCWLAVALLALILLIQLRGGT